MNKDEALKRSQELLDYYGSGKHKPYEEVTLPDGRQVYRFTVTPVRKEQPVSTNERDTQFAHAAKLLGASLEIYVGEWNYTILLSANAGQGDIPPLDTLIARFLYDFKEHVLRKVEVSNPDLETGEKPLVIVPDMTEWSDT